jgi:hypothetical protein
MSPGRVLRVVPGLASPSLSLLQPRVRWGFVVKGAGRVRGARWGVRVTRLGGQPRSRGGPARGDRGASRGCAGGRFLNLNTQRNSGRGLKGMLGSATGAIGVQNAWKSALLHFWAKCRSCRCFGSSARLDVAACGRGA